MRDFGHSPQQTEVGESTDGSGHQSTAPASLREQRMNRLSWNEVETAAQQLVQKIKDSGFEPDCLIGITTGGLFPLAMLAKRFTGKQIYTVTTKRHYDGTKDWITVEYMPVADLEGKSILLIDEITHIGTTIQSMAEVLRTEYKAGCVKTATLAANHDVIITGMFQFRSEKTAKTGVYIQVRLGGNGTDAGAVGAGHGGGVQETGTENQQIIRRKRLNFGWHPVPDHFRSCPLPAQVKLTG